MPAFSLILLPFPYWSSFLLSHYSKLSMQSLYFLKLLCSLHLCPSVYIRLRCDLVCTFPKPSDLHRFYCLQLYSPTFLFFFFHLFISVQFPLFLLPPFTMQTSLSLFSPFDFPFGSHLFYCLPPLCSPAYLFSFSFFQFPVLFYLFYTVSSSTSLFLFSFQFPVQFPPFLLSPSTLQFSLPPFYALLAISGPVAILSTVSVNFPVFQLSALPFKSPCLLLSPSGLSFSLPPFKCCLLNLTSFTVFLWFAVVFLLFSVSKVPQVYNTPVHCLL